MPLPQVGLEAVLMIRDFQRNQRTFQRLMKEVEKLTQTTADAVNRAGQKMARSFDELSKSSKVFADIFNKEDLAAFQLWGFQVNAAFEKLGSNARVNVQMFDDLIQKGLDVDTAMLAAAGKIDLNAAAMQSAAVAAGVFGTALGVTLGILRASIREYEEFGKQVRRLHLQVGLSTEEASKWIRALELAGVGQRTAERGLTTFARKLGDLQLDMAAGKEVTGDFARALDLLNISATDSVGNMRPFSDLLIEVNEKVSALEPGILRNTILMNLFGYAGRDMAVALGDANRTLEELGEESEKLGAILSTLDKDRIAAAERSTAKLNQAWKALTNQAARRLVPTLTAIKNVAADIINGYRKVGAAMAAAFDLARSPIQILARSTEDTNVLGKFFVQRMEEILGVETEVAQKEQELADQRRQLEEATLLANEAERARQEELEKTQQELDELIAKYEEARLAAQQKALDRRVKLEESFGQNLLSQALRIYWNLQRVDEKESNKRAKIIADANDRIAELEADRAKRIARFDEDARDRREDLAIRHAERLRRINQNYYDSVEEAARKNDAIAVLQARRRRRRELRDEGIRHGIDVTKLDRDLGKQRRRLLEDTQERINDARKARDKRLRELEKEYDEREDLEREKLEQILGMMDGYWRAQFEGLKDAQGEELALLRWRHDRQLDDLRAAGQKRLDELESEHNKEQMELEQHMDELENIAYDATISISNRIAEAITTGGQVVLAAEEQWLRRHLALQSSAAISSWGLTPEQQRRSRGTFLSRASGGVDVVNKPTRFIAGDAGPEMHAWMPLRGNMNVNHSFGNLPVNVNGQGAGNMNRSQMEALVWDCLDYIGDRMNVGRH